MEVFLNLFDDWVGVLSLITVLTVIVMSIYFSILFMGPKK